MKYWNTKIYKLIIEYDYGLHSLHRFLHSIYFFFTILSSGIRCKWPNQLNCCAFMWFIMLLCLINSTNSSFVLILHVPSLSFVGPKIFLNTFLSNTINSFFMVSFKTHTSQAHVTVGIWLPVTLEILFPTNPKIVTVYFPWTAFTNGTS